MHSAFIPAGRSVAFNRPNTKWTGQRRKTHSPDLHYPFALFPVPFHVFRVLIKTVYFLSSRFARAALLAFSLSPALQLRPASRPTEQRQQANRIFPLAAIRAEFLFHYYIIFCPGRCRNSSSFKWIYALFAESICAHFTRSQLKQNVRVGILAADAMRTTPFHIFSSFLLSERRWRPLELMRTVASVKTNEISKIDGERRRKIRRN